MSAPPIIDVSGLPHSAMDHRSSIWWGNALLVLIETTMFALLIAGYFYVRPQFETWPPTHVSPPVSQPNPVPSLGWPWANLVLLVASLGPMLWADRSALHRRVGAVKIALVLSVLCGAGAAALRFGEFQSLHFRWDDNAYGSFVWTILGLHLLHILIGMLENVMMTAWVFLKGLDDKHARDVRVAAVYWYWVVGTWIVIFAIVFLGPRLGKG